MLLAKTDQAFPVSRSVPLFLAMYGACLLAAWVTELLAMSSGQGPGISIWLPTGFITAAAIASPVSRWPLWALGAAAAEATGNLLWYGHDWGPASVIIFGNVLAAFAGAYFVTRTIEQRYVFATVKNALLVLAAAVILMPLISSAICSLGLGWSYGRAPYAEWPRILLGDATGAVVAAPAALLLFGRAAELPHLSRQRKIEAAVLTIFFLFLAALSLGGFFPFAFIMLTPILWAALRFRVTGAVAASVALAFFASFLTAADLSPFAVEAVYGNYGPAALQIFLLVVTTSAILIGAIAEENREALRRLYASNRNLEDRVEERSGMLAASEARANEASRLLEAIGEACPDLIFAKDRQYDMIYANAATLSALGIKRGDGLIGQSEERHYSDHSEFSFIRQNDEQVMKTGETLIVEEPLTDASGDRRIYRSTKAPLFDGTGQLAGIAGVSVDITDLKKAQRRERILLREVEHRARNVLAVLQSIIQLTSAGTVNEYKDAITGRVRALARVNGAISESNWEGASFTKILRDELAPYRDPGDQTVALNGPDVLLDTATAQAIALILHELATNAAKYGALSKASGHLHVAWTVDRADDLSTILSIEWREQGGPRVSKPKRHGFGTTLVEMFGEDRPGSSVVYQWDDSGLHVQITATLYIEAPDNA